MNICTNNIKMAKVGLKISQIWNTLKITKDFKMLAKVANFRQIWSPDQGQNFFNIWPIAAMKIWQKHYQMISTSELVGSF